MCYKVLRYLYRLLLLVDVRWGHSSVVEHLTADQEVPGSNLGAPSFFSIFFFHLAPIFCFRAGFVLICIYFMLFGWRFLNAI